MNSNIALVIGGMLTMIVGLIVAGVVNSIAATQGAAANIGSFSGAQNLNDLLPTIFYIGLIVLGLGAMGLGGFRIARGGGRRR